MFSHSFYGWLYGHIALFAFLCTFQILSAGATTVPIIPIMNIGLSFSLTRSENGQRTPQEASNFKQLATAIKAIKDINTGNGTIVPALQGFQQRCSVRFEYTVMDTVSSFSATIQQYNNLKEVQGLPLAIVGPARSSSTIPLSFVSGADNVPIVGFSATSTELDDRASHKYFSRVIPSDTSVSRAIVGFLQKYEYPRAALLYVDDSYGRSIKEELFRYSDAEDITLSLFPFDLSDNGSIDNALESLKESRLNIIIAVILEEDIKYTIEQAKTFQLIGDDQLWIFTDSVSSESILTVENQKCLEGSFQVLAASKPTANFQTFESSFGSFDIVEEMKRHLPGGSSSIEDLGDEIGDPNFTIPDDFLNDGPAQFTDYVYDAVVTIALALEQKSCQQNDTFIEALTGEEFQAIITNSSFQFPGVTGNIRFLPTGARDPATQNFPLFNYQPGLEKGDTLRIVPVGNFDSETGLWSVQEDLLVFSDGTENAPSFTTIPKEEMNDISIDVKMTCFILGSVVILLALLMMLWTYLHNRQPVIRASQPLFLYILLTGVIISSSSIFFTQLVYDEAESDHIFCYVPWWLLSIGFTLVASSLSVKLYRIKKLFNNPRLEQVHVKSSHMLAVVVTVLLLDIAVLILWTYFVPLNYSREVITADDFGFPLESYGSCRPANDWNSEEIMATAVLCLFHLLQYVAGGYLAFKTREAPSDFQEGKWLTVSVMSQVQLFSFGIPLIFAIDESETTLKDLTQTILIWLVNFVLVLLLFFPKLWRLNFDSGVDSLLIKLGLRKESKRQTIQLDLWSGSKRSSFVTGNNIYHGHASSDTNKNSKRSDPNVSKAKRPSKFSNPDKVSDTKDGRSDSESKSSDKKKSSLFSWKSRLVSEDDLKLTFARLSNPMYEIDTTKLSQFGRRLSESLDSVSSTV